jgi:hypothetical protein
VIAKPFVCGGIQAGAELGGEGGGCRTGAGGGRCGGAGGAEGGRRVGRGAATGELGRSGAAAGGGIADADSATSAVCGDELRAMVPSPRAAPHASQNRASISTRVPQARQKRCWPDEALSDITGGCYPGRSSIST